MPFEGFPLVVGWELTLGCNLRCRHCASSAGTKRANELSLHESLALCDQFPALLVQEVDFTGGEALLNPSWEAIARRLRDLEIQVRMVSNGLALSEETVKRIRDAGITCVAVSIDGLEPTHDSVRGVAGAWRRGLDGLRRVADAGLQAAAITAVNARAVRELAAMRPHLAGAGVTTWQLQPVFPWGRANDAADLRLDEESYLALGRFVETAGQVHDGIEVRAADSCGYFCDGMGVGEGWMGCSAGIAAVGIMSDGRVKGCLSMPDELVEGSLREADLWDIWFRPGAFAYTREFAIGKLGANCRGCEKGEQCQGGCTAMSYTMTGGFHNDPYCFRAIQAQAGAALATL
jgi:radical SAM protein with 4Fe4S-binding SPASM domain